MPQYEAKYTTKDTFLLFTTKLQQQTIIIMIIDRDHSNLRILGMIDSSQEQFFNYQLFFLNYNNLLSTKNMSEESSYFDQLLYQQYESSDTQSNQFLKQNLNRHDPLIQSNNGLSQYRQEYQNYFSDVELEIDCLIKQNLKNYEERKSHKLVLLDENKSIHDLISFNKPIIYILGHLYGGVVIKYQIIIGNYKLSLDLLNLNFYAPQDLVEIGKGAYGKILKVTINGEQKFVAKRILFHQKYKIIIDTNECIKPNRPEINEAICQYAIYKICSFYKIGPKVIRTLGFDLVCFQNCIQFYIQYCNKIILLNPNREKQLKIAIRLLHKLKIIHKDIKPSNLLYSHTYEKIVLCDFGISHTIKQQQGYVTKTYKQGSQIYMCPEMIRIKEGMDDYVDLYYNDLHGLKRSLLEFKQFYQSRRNSFFEQNDNDNTIFKTTYAKSNSLYKAINFFYCLINNNIQHVINQMNLDTEWKLTNDFFKLIMNQEIKKVVLLNKNVRDKIVVDLKKGEDKQKIFNLIRCYGLTELLYDQLELLPKTDLIVKIQNRINQYSTSDLTHWQNLSKLQKIIPLRMKLERQIKILEASTNGIESNTLLELYFTLFYCILNKQNYINIQCIELKNKIFEVYKVKQVDFRYELFALIINIFNDNQNIYKIHQKAIKQFIQKYPQEQELALQKILQFCKRKYSLRYSLKLLAIYQKKATQHRKICNLLNDIILICIQNGQQQMFRRYLCELQQIVQYVIAQNKKQLEIEVYVWLGNIQTIKGNYSKAIEYYKTCEEKQKISHGKLSLNRANILFQIGQKYFRLQDYNNSLEYINQSLQLYKLYLYQQHMKIKQCYIYICTIYFVNKNIQLFNKYLDMYLYEGNNHIMNHKLSNLDPEAQLIILINNCLIQIKLAQSNHQQITNVRYAEYCSIFNFAYHTFKRKSQIISFIQNRFKIHFAQSLFAQFAQDLQISLKYLRMLFQFIVKNFLDCRNLSKSYLNQYLKFEQINKNIRLPDILVYQLYTLISQQYFRIQEYKLCYAYLKKIFRTIKDRKLTAGDIKCISNLINLSFLFKSYHQCIYFITIMYKHNLNLQYNPNFHRFRIQSLFSLHKQTKKILIVHVQYLKQCIPWQVSSYQKLMKLYHCLTQKDNFMIIRCYLAELLKDKINTTNYGQIRQNLVFNYNVCKIIFTDGQTKSEQQIFKVLKISKKCLSIKLRIGCLKYVKSKNLRKMIKKCLKELK